MRDFGKFPNPTGSRLRTIPAHNAFSETAVGQAPALLAAEAFRAACGPVRARPAPRRARNRTPLEPGANLWAERNHWALGDWGTALSVRG